MSCQAQLTRLKGLATPLQTRDLQQVPYLATCHCGAITIEVKRAPRTVTDCNCSICRRYGTLWAYYNESTVRVRCAKGALASYAWGGKTLLFNHCKRCACVTHHQRAHKSDKSTVGVNARLFEPALIERARVRRLDGAATWKYLE
jgi:hypothetical protein